MMKNETFMTAPRPSIAAQQIPGWQQGIRHELNMKVGLFSSELLKLPELKQELGPGDEDLPPLTLEDVVTQSHTAYCRPLNYL